MIMGKRQIVLASLILILGVAIYLNWQFSGADQTLTEQTNGETSSRNYGETQLANAGVSAAVDANAQEQGEEQVDSIAQTKLNRKKTRDESLAQIKSITENASADAEEVKKALEKAEGLVQITESEMQAESLIQSKGITDCVVFCDGESTSVIAKSEGLSADQVTQIRDIVIEKFKTPVSNISISEIK